MLLNDEQIEAEAMGNGMIHPYIGAQVRLVGVNYQHPVISYGQSSYGYDIRLGDEVKLFTPVNEVVDPKGFNDAALCNLDVFDDGNGRYIILPPHSFALGHTLEEFSIPPDVLVICLGKSTYARCGVILNVTPLEPGWRGYATLELSNTTPKAVKVYTREGIGQLIFLRGDEQCTVTYGDRAGKYQDQPRRIVTAKV